MPRFPLLKRLALPAIVERLLPGKPHPDGRRYLPQLLLRLDDGTLIAVVDRHHRFDARMVGQHGVARLVFLLSSIALQPPGVQRSDLDPGPLEAGRASTAPDLYGQVLAVPTWEIDDRAGYEALYTELLLHIGLGVVGVRTSATAPRLVELLGRPRLEAGDWVVVRRSRIDILEFAVQDAFGEPAAP